MHTNSFSKIFIFISACSLLFACSSDNPKISLLPSGATILAFGDSITYGTGAGRNESYPAILETLSGKTVINAGIPVEITAEGRKRLPDLLEKHSPDLLILCHGGNDMMRQMNGKVMQENLRAMIRDTRNRGVSVVLISVPKPALFLSSADGYEQIAEELSVPIEDNILADILSDNALKSDQIHPNAKGYKILAEAIHILLQESGAL